ncbi:MAG: RNA polymerase sigma factor, partial [Clostridia bacterium]|nr:RNA polymerase sigma factor [Clostridia bacterium]
MEFEDLLHENYRPLERFVKFRIGNREDAQDVIQEICLAAFQNFSSLNDTSNFKPWLIGIARHKCNDYYRTKAKSAEVSFENIAGETASMSIYGFTEQSTVAETIDALDEKYGQILDMYYLMDMPQAEIAKRLGIPLGTVKSRLHNAKLKFKESYPYNMKQKGVSFMKNLPHIMPEYSIVKSDKEPFEAVCKELPGWLIIPRIGEHIVFG